MPSIVKHIKEILTTENAKGIIYYSQVVSETPPLVKVSVHMHAVSMLLEKSAKSFSALTLRHAHLDRKFYAMLGTDVQSRINTKPRTVGETRGVLREGLLRRPFLQPFANRASYRSSADYQRCLQQPAESD